MAAKEKYDALLRAIPDAMIMLSQDCEILDYRPGNSEHPLPDPGDGPVPIAKYLPATIAEIWSRLSADVQRSGKPRHYEFALPTSSGNIAHYVARFVPFLDQQTLVVVTEFTANKRAEERIHKLAYYDALTELPNRQFFLRQLDQMIDEARRADSQVAILYVDLDNFKRINDNLGHSYGDGVLKAIAERMSGCIRKQAPSENANAEPFGIARLGGDEFVCAIEGAEDEDVMLAVADRIRDQLRKPVRYRSHEFVVTPSIGISMFPQDGDNVEDLLKHADVAMYQAKGAGRNSVRFYSGTMSLRSMRRLELEGGLRKAIENDRLELHYQPKRNLETGDIIGVEALARWQDEEGTYIPPGHFIPVAEETGLITALGEWVLKAACSQVRDWKDRLGFEIEVAVNISSQQLYQSDLKKTVMRALFEAAIKPNLLQLELTESLLMRDVQDTIETLTYLKEAGVSLAIDDFGTGYSSLSYLKRFPLDALKIDQSFVAELADNNDDAAICAAIIAMAHRLGLQVIAEGIETDYQLNFLRDQGCELGQGYLLGKPLPAAAFEHAVTSRRKHRMATSDRESQLMPKPSRTNLR